jgi:hypothetical protein
MDLSIIIVNYRSWNHLKKCIDGIQAFNKLNLIFEVIVVDNCSNDGYFDEFSNDYPNIYFILNSGNNGFSNGCNLGSRKAKGKFYLFLNTDILVSEDVIVRLVNSIQLFPEYTILSCKQLNKEGQSETMSRLFPSLVSINGICRSIYKLFMKLGTGPTYSANSEILDTDWVSGSVLLISSDQFALLGGWDESFWMYYEDVDLCRRTYKKGGKSGILQSVSMVHFHGGSSRQNSSTAVLTKTEVVISFHVYLSKHFKGFLSGFLHFMIILNILVIKLIPALLGLLFFFVTKLNIISRVYIQLIAYYYSAIVNRTWLSKRSVLYGKKTN